MFSKNASFFQFERSGAVQDMKLPSPVSIAFKSKKNRWVLHLAAF